MNYPPPLNLEQIETNIPYNMDVKLKYKLRIGELLQERFNLYNTQISQEAPAEAYQKESKTFEEKIKPKESIDDLIKTMENKEEEMKENLKKKPKEQPKKQPKEELTEEEKEKIRKQKRKEYEEEEIKKQSKEEFMKGIVEQEIVPKSDLDILNEEEDFKNIPNRDKKIIVKISQSLGGEEDIYDIADFYLDNGLKATMDKYNKFGEAESSKFADIGKPYVEMFNLLDTWKRANQAQKKFIINGLHQFLGTYSKDELYNIMEHSNEDEQQLLIFDDLTLLYNEDLKDAGYEEISLE